MAGDNSPAFINKTIRNALNVANLSPEDIAKVSDKDKPFKTFTQKDMQKIRELEGCERYLKWVKRSKEFYSKFPVF